MKTPIFDFVKGYAEKDVSRFHMPGHKGQALLGLEALDITEISGADSITEATVYSVIITPDYATNKEVEWSISNPEIATIDQNGVVTPLTSGLVTVTATAKDGSEVFATREIEIIKLAESIEIMGENSISSPAQYTAIVSPDYTSDKEVSDCFGFSLITSSFTGFFFITRFGAFFFLFLSSAGISPHFFNNFPCLST